MTLVNNIRSAALGVAVATVSLLGSSARAAQPNVLFIAVDDLKPTIGAFGDTFARTPNLDALARRGVVFANAHCQQAVCAPSRVSLLTGLRPDTTKVWDLKTPFRPILPKVVTLPERFKQSGYEVVGMGKIYDPRSAGGEKRMDPASWSRPYVQISAPASETFSYRNPDVIKEVTERRVTIADMPKTWDKQIEAIFPDGKPATDRADVPDNAYEDGAMTEIAIKHLDEFKTSGKPFFLAVGYKKPHLPFNAPEKYWAMYDRAQVPLATVTRGPEGAPEYAPQPGWELRTNYRDIPRTGLIPEDKQRELVHGYYAATSYIDAQVGMLVKALDERGLRDNTIIVLWGDHGWHLGDHGMWCKHTNYEQATRSPLMVIAPGVGKPGVSNAPVEFVDIYPTLIDLAGIDAAGDLHGKTLKPILLDDKATVKPVAISQYPRGGANDGKMGYAYRDERYRLVRWYDFDEAKAKRGEKVLATELYDYQADPLETKNLADDPAHAKARAEMEAKATAAEY